MAKFIITVIMLLALSQQTFAQLTKQKAQKKYEAFNHQWERKTISTDSFLNGVKLLSAQMMRQQAVFSTDELSHLLDDFREAAWRSDKYSQYKIVYFTVLLNNADMLGKGGEAIFYADKLEQLLPDRNFNSKLPTIYMKCAFYDQNGNYKEAIKTYQSIASDINKLIQTAPDSLNRHDYRTTIQILNIIVHSYSELKDSAASSTVVQQSEGLYNALIKTEDEPHTPPIILCRVLVNFIQIENALLDNHYTKAQSYLEQCDTLTNALTQFPLINQIKAGTIALWLKYYLAVKDYDHAAHYLKLFNEGAHFYPDYDSYIFQTKAKLSTIKNDYKTAYSLMQKALDSKNKNLVSVTNEMTNLLYAHAQAEFNKTELASANQAKQRRLMWLIIISIAAVITIAAFYYLYFNNKRKTKKKIATLNSLTTSQIQIAKNHAANEEKAKLAQDLHDSYSSSIAAIMKRMEMLNRELTDTKWQAETQALFQYTNTIYNAIRSKSHDLFDLSQSQLSTHFETSVRQMLDIALPDKSYKKEIDIDKDVVSILPLHHQIEMVRIIQECTTNIIKHATAATEVFVFLFEDNKNVILHIGDNGKRKSNGIKQGNTEPSLGLNSIKKRVTALNGILTCNNKDGFSLRASFPLTKES